MAFSAGDLDVIARVLAAMLHLDDVMRLQHNRWLQGFKQLSTAQACPAKATHVFWY